MRPTSETIGEYMGKWTQSYRDLPLLLNVWGNVVRWEMRPRLFLRTSEFLWQEGHTTPVDAADAAAYAKRILHEAYEDFMVNVLAIPVVVGRKTASRADPGGHQHDDLRGDDGRRQGPADGHQPRARPELRPPVRHQLPRRQPRRPATRLDHVVGSSTRMVGGLIMAHSDDRGLVVPPALAVQAVVVLVKDDDERASRSPAGRRAGGGGRPGRGRRPGGHELRGAGRPTGAQGCADPHRGRPA